MNYHKIRNILTGILVEMTKASGILNSKEEALKFVQDFFKEIPLRTDEHVYTVQEGEQDAARLVKGGALTAEAAQKFIEQSGTMAAVCTVGLWGQKNRTDLELAAQHGTHPLIVELVGRYIGKIYYDELGFAQLLVGCPKIAADAYIRAMMAHERRHAVQPEEMVRQAVSYSNDNAVVTDVKTGEVKIDEDAYYRRPWENDAEKAAVRVLIDIVRALAA